MSSVAAPICYYCQHKARELNAPWQCAAFPKGIPREIIDGEVKHTSPYPGDNGIQFEVADGEREDYEEHLRLVDRMKQRHKELIRQGIISE